MTEVPGQMDVWQCIAEADGDRCACGATDWGDGEPDECTCEPE